MVSSPTPWDSIRGISRSISGVSGRRPNAFLTYEVLIGGGSFDLDDFGNPVASPPSVEQKIIKARLYPSKSPDFKGRKGTDESRFYLEGYLVSPLTLPLPPPNIVDAIVSGYRGIWWWEMSVTSPTSIEGEIESCLGRRIAGYLQVQQGR